jgi:hypothetical protein
MLDRNDVVPRAPGVAAALLGQFPVAYHSGRSTKEEPAIELAAFHQMLFRILAFSVMIDDNSAMFACIRLGLLRFMIF